jgi:hypothetical protein
MLLYLFDTWLGAPIRVPLSALQPNPDNCELGKNGDSRESTRINNT